MRHSDFLRAKLNHAIVETLVALLLAALSAACAWQLFQVYPLACWVPLLSLLASLGMVAARGAAVASLRGALEHEAANETRRSIRP
jgi:hypothetical protein